MLRFTPTTRRLSDKILLAFQQACAQGEITVARQLLEVLEHSLHRNPSDLNRRQGLEALVEAHHQLWLMQHGGKSVTDMAAG